VIRSVEFGVPTRWGRLKTWVRRKLGRPQHVNLGAAVSAEGVVSIRGKLRPGMLGPEASDAERIARLERYVDYLDSDLNQLNARIETTKEELAREAQGRADELRQEFADRDEQRRQGLRPSLRRQAIGSVSVFAGIVLGTIGIVW
jgi:hypothetical protein